MLAVMLRSHESERYSGSIGLLAHLQDGHVQHFEETGNPVSCTWAPSGRLEKASAVAALETALRRYAKKGYHGSVGVVVYMVAGAIQRVEGRRKQIHRVSK
jgi:hypothetical protein